MSFQFCFFHSECLVCWPGWSTDSLTKRLPDWQAGELLFCISFFFLSVCLMLALFVVIHIHPFDFCQQPRKRKAQCFSQRLKNLSIFKGGCAKPQPEPGPQATVFSHFSQQERAKVRQEVDSLQRVVCVSVFTHYCVCSVSNLTLPDSSREKDILCCCFPLLCIPASP